MIPALTILLVYQLAGEVTARALGLALPGPVLGMAALIASFALVPGLYERVRPTATGLLANLSLLFVPAGVGIVGHLGRVGIEGVGVAVALVVSTVVAIGVAALTFVAVARIAGQGDAGPGEAE